MKLAIGTKILYTSAAGVREATIENIKNGTANEIKWRIYGLGLRASVEGAIFQIVKWIPEFPDGLTYWFGNTYPQRAKILYSLLGVNVTLTLLPSQSLYLTVAGNLV